MKSLRLCLAWVVLIAKMAVAPAGSEEVQRSGMVRVNYLYQVYNRAPLTVAYVPEASSSRQVAAAIFFDVLQSGERYILEARHRGTNHCFMVSHYASDLADQKSYLGVAAFSVLREEHIERVSMYRNAGWKRDDDSPFDADTTSIKPSQVDPSTFFSVHVNSSSLEELDQKLNHNWHGRYSEDGHSFTNRVNWDLSRHMERVNGNHTRFDGKLIRFTFTEDRQSQNPPTFCLRSENRRETRVILFSPHVLGPLQFTIDWRQTHERR